MQKPNITQKTADLIVMTGLNEHGDYAKFYFESNPRYSPGGGTVTMSFPEQDLIGQYFFSHVVPDTLQKFVAGCDTDYLIDKLFPKIERYSAVKDSKELFTWVGRYGMDELKQARHSGEVSKRQLRALYEEMGGREFQGLAHLVECMSKQAFKTVCAIYGNDWMMEHDITVSSFQYLRLESVMQAALEQLKQLIEVPA